MLPSTKLDTLSQKIILFNSTFSVLCYTFLYFILQYSEYNIYTLGSSKSWPILFFVFIKETIKTVYKHIQGDTNRDYKLIKGRKSMAKRFKVKDVFFASILLVVTFICICAVCVLLGAPFLSKHKETLMFSLLVVILSMYYVIATMGSEGTLNILLGSKQAFTDSMSDYHRQRVFLTMAGAWCGTFAIPLDWDRNWQKYPIPISLGAFVGNFCNDFCCIFSIVYPACKGFYLKKWKKIK